MDNKTELANILKFDESDFSLSLRIDNFSSDKDFLKFVKNVESAVRRSCEYRLWVSYLIENCGSHICALTKERTNEADVHIHHHPISLFLICKSVVEKYLDSETYFCTFDVCTKIIELHFSNKIGYIPLLASMHEKYHNGYLKLPIDLVKGGYQYMLDSYQFDEDDFKKITELQTYKPEDCEISWSKGNYPGLKNVA